MFFIIHRITKGAVAVLVVLLAIFFTSLAFPEFERVHWYRQIVITMVAPPQKAMSIITGFFGNIWHHYIFISEAAKENDLLKSKLASITMRLIETEDIRRENANLHELLAMSGSLNLKGTGAMVIACDVNAEFKTITIDKGFSDGLRKNMVVIGPGGLVGRIGKIANHTSQVLLISDPNSAVDVIVQRSGARALLMGTSGGVEARPFYSLSRLEYLRRVSDVKDGDVVITSGLDQLFPKGIPVGTLHNVDTPSSGIFRRAEIVPFVDLAETFEVMVLQ